MPNPLTRVVTPVQSKPVQDRPEPVAPIPESVKGDNNPYRGLEDHGVPSDNKPAPPGTWADNHEGFTYVKPPREQDPIPVEIVNEYGSEYRRYRIHRMSIDNTRGMQFVGRNDARTSILVQNRDAANSIFIYHAPVDPYNTAQAFELAAKEDITLMTQAPIYVVGSNAAMCTVQAIEYYSVQE